MHQSTQNGSPFNWLDERVPISKLVQFLSRKEVPRHKHTFWYYFGGLTLFFFLVQVVTGILLALHYRPSPEAAHESVVYIVNEVAHGWLIRSIHSWSANLMVAMLLVHMFSAFLLKAYRRPRELIWISGVLLLLVVLGFCFTGYLLPWDTVAYFATLIGTEVPKTLPIIGDWGVSVLKGSQEIGAETLARMYTIHIVILPLTAIVVIGFHILLNQIHGSSIPTTALEQKPPIPFFPNFVLRDALAWTLGFISLVALSVLLPTGIGEKADPFASAPAGIRPEWYFLPLYQSLRIAPASVFGISGEFLVNALVAAVGVFWLLVPFLDRSAAENRRSRLFTAIGILLIFYIAGTVLLAYTT